MWCKPMRVPHRLGDGACAEHLGDMSCRRCVLLVLRLAPQVVSEGQPFGAGSPATRIHTSTSILIWSAPRSRTHRHMIMRHVTSSTRRSAMRNGTASCAPQNGPRRAGARRGPPAFWSGHGSEQALILFVTDRREQRATHTRGRAQPKARQEKGGMHFNRPWETAPRVANEGMQASGRIEDNGNIMN